MKKILVPTDFSDHAMYASKVAARIAALTGARIYFLHVIDIPVYDSNMGIAEHQDIMESLMIMQQVKKRFNQLFEEPFLEGVNAVEVLTFSGVHENIAEQAKKHEIDLIVMGSHGAKGWTEFFVGSNTDRIVRLVDCPVITVKQDMPDFNPVNIVFSSNFDGEDNHVFEEVNQFACMFNATVHLLKVNTTSGFEPQEASIEKMKAFSSHFSLNKSTYNVYNAHNIEEGILAFSNETGADLIAMGTHGRTGIAHFFGGSIAADLVNHSRKPVLTVRIQK
ncbi:MAG: universal stress protein [Bacteroidota bacterium]